MAKHEYGVEEHRKAYELWLELGSFRAVAKEDGMPTAPTLMRWSKSDYKCPHGCEWHGWEGKRREAFAVDVTLAQPHATLEAQADIIWARRKEQLQLRSRGATREAVHRALATKYNVSPLTLDRDWKWRDSWILDIANLKNAKEAAGIRVAEFQTTNDTRWNIVNLYQEALQEWRRKKAMERAEAGERIQPEDLKEIGGIIYYISKLMGDIDQTNERALKSAFALGLNLEMDSGAEEDSSDYIDIDGTPHDSQAIIDRMLSAVPEDELGIVFQAIDAAMAGAEEGTG